MTQNVLIHTGNILSLNETKRKATQNPGDELTETLKIVLSNGKDAGGDTVSTLNGTVDSSLENVERKDLKVTVKVFISSPKAQALEEALENAYNALKTDMIESLVVAYTGQDASGDILTSLKTLWITVEKYVNKGKLSSIGVSNVNTNTFIDFYNWAKVKPGIIQINLASCCVVPPALQHFALENDIQLLTHSDPSEILPQEVANEIFDSKVNVHWIVRYQIHLKCRGILASKGYLIYINKCTPE